MPRRARQLSEVGIYHVTFRGIAGMDTFLDYQDRQKMLDRMKDNMAEGEYALYSYCLMSNHVHLLLKANEPLWRTVKRISGPYAQFFNWKYGRRGHLFQDRFHSQIINCDQYFMACARYIHVNPVKAGIVPYPEDYPWSSYRDYLRPSARCDLIQRDYLYSLFGPSEEKAVKALVSFTRKADEAIDFNLLEPGEEEIDALQRIEDILAAWDLTCPEFSRAPGSVKRRVVSEIVGAVDISGRELAKILGIAREIVYEIKSAK